MKKIITAFACLALSWSFAFCNEGLATDPKPKFTEEEVSFLNMKETNPVTLSGTLTCPVNGTKFPAIILISGSGPSDRDETIFNKHKPFKVIAEYLSSNGYAVLRYDDRGCGKSTGKPYPKHTSADLKNDVLAAVAFLKTKSVVASDKIGLLGHSEGGMIAAMVASTSSDIAFVVSLAGAGCKIEDVMKEQNRSVYAAYGKSYTDHYVDLCYGPIIKALLTDKDSATKHKELCAIFTTYHKAVPDSEYKTFVRIPDASMAEIFMLQMNSPWFRYFLAYDPTNDWKTVKIPVLALNGTKDIQVNSVQNLACIKEGLEKAGNKNFKIVSMDGYNHLFQKAKTGALSEYMTIEEAISKDALKVVLKWLNELPGNKAN